MFTYFIISPGADINSSVKYPGTTKLGNYIKFGDEKDLHTKEGIRGAYLTHNPDIGIGAIMDSTAITSPYLGTVLKNYITNTCEIQPVVGTTEWFSIIADAAWKLFREMQGWDEKPVDPNNLNRLKDTIYNCLG
jgi:hypothetical protein